jgi:hypothetical protein
MFNYDRPVRIDQRRRRPTVTTVVAATALFVVLGGTAIAASGLIQAGQIATGAVTSKKIRDGGVAPKDLSAAARATLQGNIGETGPGGPAGASGAAGPNGAPGTAGANGANGAAGAAGSNGANGANGANGPNGAPGLTGSTGPIGPTGPDGPIGTTGANGVLAPLSAKSPSVTLPPTTPPTVVLALSVPAGNYVVLAKSQLSQTGAGDSVSCELKAGPTTIDQVAMKTLPALAAVPASMQAITTTSPTQVSFECDVEVAGGSADFNSLIAVPLQ